ncbi:nicotinate-nucleotide adenylyltransferase [Acidithiobacillus montserratensis]|uniref:Nicotinate-nucleotide adenylyltransferase n=1 Tax=Acidithiobacillus montserratensis TaxID=2729135 RepID=A0ACD5HKC8_9PROT|nr:nicotinate-nucleotide adenylyltransferase [Acidithiobacillus montserratensis]MBN2679508.1 nicotinate-nucleotide adenylyltransferase [Acidithiobacillaceae bacterium]MBU2747354.1 nicotinate-nucleotide adenylyltransferase [Acidithiobacillus montserratensis]
MNTSKDHDLVILGGTFDPIHYGHLRAVEEVRQALKIAEVMLIPAGHPPHRKSPWAAAPHRLAMTRIAVAHHPRFTVSDREVHREGPSYTVDTLRSLRQERPDALLAMVIGMDAFLRFDTWRDWQEILDLTHLIVTGRPGWPAAELPEALRQTLYQRRCDDIQQLHQQSAGFIFFQTITALEISATSIRSLLANGQSPRFLLPDEVLDYIEREGLYQSP